MLLAGVALGLLIFVVFMVAGSSVRAVIYRMEARAEPEQRGTFHLLGQAAYTILLVFGAITALGTIGVVVAGFEGEVVKIDLRYTTLQRDGTRYLIPNSLLFTNAITVLQSDQDRRSA